MRLYQIRSCRPEDLTELSGRTPTRRSCVEVPKKRPRERDRLGPSPRRAGIGGARFGARDCSTTVATLCVGFVKTRWRSCGGGLYHDPLQFAARSPLPAAQKGLPATPYQERYDPKEAQPPRRRHLPSSDPPRSQPGGAIVAADHGRSPDGPLSLLVGCPLESLEPFDANCSPRVVNTQRSHAGREEEGAAMRRETCSAAGCSFVRELVKASTTGYQWHRRSSNSFAGGEHECTFETRGSPSWLGNQSVSSSWILAGDRIR